MSETIYLLTISLPLGTILLIFALWSWSATQRAKARIAAETGNATALAAIEAALADLKTRVGAIEKILKEVE